MISFHVPSVSATAVPACGTRDGLPHVHCLRHCVDIVCVKLSQLTLIRHFFTPARPASLTTMGNGAVPRGPLPNPPWVMLQMARACRQPVRSRAHGSSLAGLADRLVT